MSVILVSGALANKPFNGGSPWERLTWVRGLRRLGHTPIFIEQICRKACVDAAGRTTTFPSSVNAEYFQAVVKWFDLEQWAGLVESDSGCTLGMSWQAMCDVAASAELLINLSGHLTHQPLLRRLSRDCRKAYIDVDPGFTQFWHADPSNRFRVGGHDFYFTIGENIGSADYPVPTGGIQWRAVRQPVVLDDWPIVKNERPARFTTVSSWRGPFGPVEAGGRTFGLKVHEFRKYLALPNLADGRCAAAGADRPSFEIALNIHTADWKDLAALDEHGWEITDPCVVAGNPHTFRRFIQRSGAEFSVAQGIYVDTNSGWFSDRTVRYLASGRPALVQETGFSRNIKTGLGLVPFSTIEEAAAGAEGILRNYAEHAAAARSIAEEYFDSDKVLGRFLEEVGVR